MVYDVGIIGGGIIGLSCAWRLAQAGLSVALLERGELAREASWAGAGLLAAQCEAAHFPPDAPNALERQAMLDLCIASRALYPNFAAELSEATDIDIDLTVGEAQRGDGWHGGILYISTRDDDPAPAAFAVQREAGHRVLDLSIFGSVSEGEFREHIGAVSRRRWQASMDYHQALWLPDEGRVNTRLAVRALVKAVRRAGVTLFTGEPVTEVRCVGERIESVVTLKREVTCAKILLCAGSWSGKIPGIPNKCLPPVRPVAGHVIAVRAPEAGLEHAVYSSDLYLVPRRNQKQESVVLLGATVEEVGFRKECTVSGAMQLLNAACRVLPELESCAIDEQWVGLRPGTPDGLPILGRTELENLFVATGHYRNGVLLTPITAQLMTACIVNNEQPPALFAGNRFGGGDDGH